VVTRGNRDNEAGLSKDNEASSSKEMVCKET